ncbi:MAG: helix-turn-helix domain-containing protein [Acutalibacteraceae bacterium]
MKINEKIYTLRKKFGWSQDELAEKLSVSRQSVSKWETGDSVPESAKIPEIAKIFSVSTDYLLDDSKDEYIFPQAEESIDTADKIMSKGELLFRNYGWILGVALILFGLYRIACVVSIFSFFLQGGVVGVAGLIGSPVILPVIFSALMGLAFVACGIIMIKRLRKNKK